MNRLSKKRAKQNRLYLKLRKKFLEENYLCQAGLEGCRTVSSTIHHQKGRIGGELTNVENFLACCMSCHDIIHNEPKLALKNGFSKMRLI